jgi:hypothetical protein
MNNLLSISNLVKTDLQRVQRSFGIERSPQLSTKQLEGQDLLAGSLNLNGLELLLLFSDSYPTMPPIVLDRDTEQLELHWPLNTPPEERLIAAIQWFLDGRGYYPKPYPQTARQSPSSQPRIDRSFSLLEWIFGG